MAIDQPTPSIRLQQADSQDRRTLVLLFLLFFGGYAVLIAWFRYVDVYHTHFSSAGVFIFVNNLFRVLFIFYLFWIVQATGATLLRLLGRCDPDALGTLDYLALTFFAGTGPWHVTLLAVGYSNLLNVGVMVILTAPMVALSFLEFRLVAPRLQTGFVRRFKEGTSLFKFACLSLGVIWCALLLVKGLYPAGGDDYYKHYFPGYQAILAHGGVWPNEVWIHYFWSKGAGLFFLGMLLTDPLAPQLVTFCFVSLAGIATFLFTRGLAPSTAWPIVAILLFFGLFTYGPEWGEFHKPHELNASLVIAIFWMTVGALVDTTSRRRIWLAAAASAMTAAIIIGVNIGAFLGAVFGALTLAYSAMGDRHRGLICFAFAALAGVLVGLVLVINFVTSGLLNGGDPSFLFFWKFANVEKLHQWGALPMVLWLHLFTVRQASILPQLLPFKLVIKSLRLDLLWPLFFGGPFVAAISAYDWYRFRGFVKSAISHAGLVLIAALAAFTALALIGGRAQPSSFFRVSSFVVPLVIVAAVAMWRMPTRHQEQSFLMAVLRHRGVPIVVLALCAAMLVGRARLDRTIGPLNANALAYAIGILSIDEAYAPEHANSTQAPWGGIYRGARGAYAIVGPRSPIWSMNVFCYCMLPDCKIMSFWYDMMTRAWDRVIWGTPEEGQQALRAAGLNFFLFSRELGIFGPLPLSPLFSPDNIGRYFGIRWTDGTTTLLTWPGPDTTTPDEAWLAEYRAAVAASPFLKRFPNAEMKAIFDQLHATPHPWRSFELTWPMQ